MKRHKNSKFLGNPLYSADACFARLPIRFKKLFRKRNIPKVFFFHNYRLRQIDLYEAKEEKIMKEKVRRKFIKLFLYLIFGEIFYRI